MILSLHRSLIFAAREFLLGKGKKCGVCELQQIRDNGNNKLGCFEEKRNAVVVTVV